MKLEFPVTRLPHADVSCGQVYPGRIRLSFLARNRGQRWKRNDDFQFQRQGILLLFTVLMAASMYLFYSYISLPAPQSEHKLTSGPDANFSDLYPAWLGTRELLFNNRDPYSAGVTASIQKGVWGRTVDSSKPGDPKDESRFAYPLYVVFLIAPTVLFSFSTAEVLFVAFAIAAGILSVWFWFRFFNPDRTAFQIGVAAVLFLGSWPFVLALRVHQPALIVLALMTGAVAALASALPWVGGVLLALSTIKPQAVIGITGWLLLWSVSNWKDRKGLFISFALTLCAIFVGAETLLPGWFGKWGEALSAYMRYAPLPGALVQLLFGNLLGKVVGALVVLGIVVFCLRIRKDRADSDRFKLAFALIVSANLFITPVWHPYDHIFLLPSVLLVWEWRAHFYRLKPVQRGILRFSALALLWQWLAAAIGVGIAIAAPQLATSLRILPYVPYFSIVLLPPVVLTSLALIGYARLSSPLQAPSDHMTGTNGGCDSS